MAVRAVVFAAWLCETELEDGEVRWGVEGCGRKDLRKDVEGSQL